MEKSIQTDPWVSVVEELQSNQQFSSDTVFWLGNGKIGQSGNFEDFYSGDLISGTNISGITSDALNFQNI